MEKIAYRSKRYYAKTRVLTIKISKEEEEFLRNESFRLKKPVSELIRNGALNKNYDN